jgi:UMF1 family MFS transporter
MSQTTGFTGLRRRELAWALYDVANSAFATTVMAAFFPVFLKQYWAEGVPATESTFWLGLTSSMAALAALLLSPILGSMSDAGGLKKPLLALCAMTGVAMTSGLYWVEPGQHQAALWLFGLGNVAFLAGMVLYDALLPAVTVPARYERLSALGVGLGYLGGGLLFAFNVLMVRNPTWFGLPDAAAAVRISFLLVAAWWLVFTLPLLFVVREPGSRRKPVGSALRAGLRQLRATFSHIRRLRVVMLFLMAYWLYIDGVDTIVLMAVDYAMAIGFEADGLMLALLITQAVGVPATLAFGRLGERFGAKPAILAGLAVYAALVLWGATMTRPWEFYGIAGVIGLVQGGVQALSRALYARIIPKDKAGEFFGFMNLLGKFAAVLGPLLVGAVSRLSGEPRLSLLSLLILFAGGAWLLSRVDVREGERRAAEL